MIRLAGCSALLLATLFFFSLSDASPPQPAPQQTDVKPTDKPPTPLTPLMRLKLESAKLILEGLTLEEFDKVAKNARKLKLLSTESGWNVLQTEEYEAQSKDFRRTTDLISEAAEAKDVSRAALGYVALTVRCVECHSYMRKMGKGVGLSAERVDSGQ